MGNRYEVHVWKQNLPGYVDQEAWGYEEVWRGESLLRCLWAGARARRDYGCVKLVLR